MNTQVLLVSILALSLLPASAQWRQDPQINVSGSAEIKVTPNEIHLTAGVETRHETLAEAKRQNDNQVSRALKFLKDNGIEDKNIQTDYVIIEPVYDPSIGVDPRTGLPLPGYDKKKADVEPAYYQVRKTIGVKLTNVRGFDFILSGLITNGVNNVRRVDFRTSELRQYKDKARAMALQAAKEKAEAAATQLGVKLGKPQGININDWSGWSGWSPQSNWSYGGGAGGAMQNISQNAPGESGEAGATFAVGQISVSATVNVSFLIK